MVTDMAYDDIEMALDEIVVPNQDLQISNFGIDQNT